MSEHTPGPWGVTAAMKTSAWGVCAPSGQIVKDIFQQADARLIAAAPDMLAALILALPALEDHYDSPTYVAMDAAIAKAKGV